MMSCITAALTREGYGWEGTGGSQGGVNDPGITYISAITYGDDKLEEFDGKNTSGWMGVLNDWFTMKASPLSALRPNNGITEL